MSNIAESFSTLVGGIAARAPAVKDSRRKSPRQKVVPIGDFERAAVKWYNPLKGFGFLTQGEGTRDIFVHVTVMNKCGIDDLKTGDTVSVLYGRSSKGLQACEVRLLQSAPRSVEPREA